MTRNRHRFFQGLAYVVGGSFLLASMLWLGFAGNKSPAILLALAAVVSARILYVSLPDYLEQRSEPDNPDSDAEKAETSENASQEGPPGNRSDSI